MTPRRLRYTVWGPGEAPIEGSIIRTRARRTGKFTKTVYLVLKAKQIGLDKDGNRRLALVVIRVGADYPWPDKLYIHELWWDRRTFERCKR